MTSYSHLANALTAEPPIDSSRCQHSHYLQNRIHPFSKFRFCLGLPEFYLTAYNYNYHVCMSTVTIKST